MIVRMILEVRKQMPSVAYLRDADSEIQMKPIEASECHVNDCDKTMPSVAAPFFARLQNPSYLATIGLRMPLDTTLEN
jgi:hypothetical protein